MRASRKSPKKLWDVGTHPWDGGVADPVKRTPAPCVLQYQTSFPVCQTLWAYIGWSQIILGTSEPRPLGTGAWLTPRNTLVFTCVTTPNFVAVGRTVWEYVGVPNIWGRWSTISLGWGVADPYKYASPPVLLCQIWSF